MDNLEGQVAIVTGSVRSIGKAIALLLAALGADVVVDYSTDETRSAFGKLNIAVANAGVELIGVSELKFTE